MRNFPIATVMAASFVLAPLVAAANDQNANKPRSSADNSQNNKKVLAAKGGGLLNSDATPEQAKKTAEETNRQILEKQRKR